LRGVHRGVDRRADELRERLGLGRVLRHWSGRGATPNPQEDRGDRRDDRGDQPPKPTEPMRPLDRQYGHFGAFGAVFALKRRTLGAANDQRAR
jgi:hypothetical protein